MTNLADLLPAGGGQNNTDFVADGNISAGAPVILTAAGKAAAVAISSTSLSENVGTETQFFNGNAEYTAACFDSDTGQVIVTARDQSALSYGKAVVGTVSGNTISFGTPTTYLSATTSWQAAVYDSVNQKVVILYNAALAPSYTSTGYAIVGTVSGTSISFGSAVAYTTQNPAYVSASFDSSSGKIVIAFMAQANSNYATSVVGTVSGTSISFGSDVVFRSANTQEFACVYDTNADKTVICYRESSVTGAGEGIVGTVSGTSISYGTAVQFDTSPVTVVRAAYDSSSNQIICAYTKVTTKVVLGTVSGTSISFGAIASAPTSDSSVSNSVCYDSNVNKIVVTYAYGGASPYANGTIATGTVSGTSLTFATPPATFNPTTVSEHIASVYDSTNKKAVVFYGENNASAEGLVFQAAGTAQVPNLTSTNLLGLAPEAISDTATGTINTWGSRCESSSILADSLSLGSPDTTSGNGQKENVSMAYDSNADRTILVYRDGGDSDKLKCIIGTVSGTSTSWGTAVEIVGATAGNRGTAVVYDSNAQRVLIAYTKASDNYAYVRVGEISGTSVTLGTEVAASSSNSYYPELSYDVADQKVLLVFANAGDNYYPYSAACTITAVGNSVAVTTPASVSSRNAYDPFGLAYNANDAKHVLDITDNTATGYAYVLTMSSGSISVGAEASYSPGFTPRQSICVYDSSAQKIVRAYYSNSSPYPVSAAVASISGTNVTFGTAATAFTTNSGTRFHGTFDSSSNQVGFVSRTNSTNYIETNFGSVSGTTITFATATSVYSGGTASINYNIVYDSTAQKLIYAYAGATYDAVVGSFGTTPLTVTSDYYVQEDGTISTTSTSPAQLIGNAIKTNQINIKDYTG